MSNQTKHFLLIDDDPLNNSLSKLVLRKTLGKVEVIDFLVPENGLEFIEFKSHYHSEEEKVTLLLDINMPSMTGWEFLDKFDQFKNSLKEQFNIYILSSSIDPCDISRAKENPLVIDFIEKPLNKASLNKIFESQLKPEIPFADN